MALKSENRMEKKSDVQQLRLRLVGAAIMASAIQVAVIVVMLAFSSTLELPHFRKAVPAMLFLTLVVICAQWVATNKWMAHSLDFDETRPAEDTDKIEKEQLRQAQQELVVIPTRLALLSVGLWMFCGLFLLFWLILFPWPRGAIFYWWEAALVLLLSLLLSLIGYVFINYSSRGFVRNLAGGILAADTGTGEADQLDVAGGLAGKLKASFLSLTVGGTMILLILFVYQTSAGERVRAIESLNDIREEWNKRLLKPEPGKDPATLIIRSSKIFKADIFIITRTGDVIVPEGHETLPGLDIKLFQDRTSGFGDASSEKVLTFRTDKAREYILIPTVRPPGVNQPVFIGQAFTWSGLGGWKLGPFLICASFVALIILLTWRVVSLSAEDLLIPVNTLMEESRKVSQGELDVSFSIVRKDEIGGLAAGMKAMAANLRTMIKRLRDAYQNVEGVVSELKGSSGVVARGSSLQRSEVEDTSKGLEDMMRVSGEVSERAAELSGAIVDGGSRIEEMMAMVEETAKAMEELSASVEKSSTSILEMIASIKEIAAHADELSQRSEETNAVMIDMEASIRDVDASAKESQVIAEMVRDHARSGVEAVQSTIQGIGEIEGAVRRAMERMDQLGQSTGEIGKILSVIRDVTNQTNLLALNAAIIASQAGEHGKGFAVVADEIKSLADRTTESTKEIDDIIKRVRLDTRQVVEMMNEGYQSVETGVNLSYVAGEALEKIEKSVEQSQEMVDRITQSMSEQAKNTRRVTEATEAITNLIHEIATGTSQQSKGSDMVLQSSEQIKQISVSVSQKATRQSESARRVQELMEGLNELVVLFNSSHSTEKEVGERIMSAMGRIREITSENERSVASLDRNIALLKKQAETLASVLSQFKTG